MSFTASFGMCENGIGIVGQAPRLPQTDRQPERSPYKTTVGSFRVTNTK
jgi:hypothetical protein